MPDRMRPTGSDSVARSDGGTGRFLSRQEATGTYASRNLTGTNAGTAMRNFHSSLANAANAACKVFVLGDSVAEGQGASSVANRFAGVMLAKMRAGYQPSGVAGGRGFLPPQWTTSLSGIAQPAANSGGLGNITNNFGPSANCRGISGAQTYTWTVSGTSVDIVWVKGAATGTFSWAVDGGTATNVPTNLGSPNTDFRTTRVSLGSRGSHTVTVAVVSGTCFIDGIIEYDQDESAGIQLINGGHYGYETGDWVTQQVTPGYLGNQMAAWTPNLVLIELLENDYLHNKTSASAAANLQAIVTAINGAVTPAPSIVLLANFQATNVSPLEPWSNYVAAGLGVVNANSNMAMLDLSGKMPAITGDALSLYSDAFHPSPKGHAWMGSMVAQALLPLTA